MTPFHPTSDSIIYTYNMWYKLGTGMLARFFPVVNFPTSLTIYNKLYFIATSNCYSMTDNLQNLELKIIKKHP